LGVSLWVRLSLLAFFGYLVEAKSKKELKQTVLSLTQLKID